jgi:hypothetical protein
MTSEGEVMSEEERRGRADAEKKDRAWAAHPATEALLEFFAYEHLPPNLQKVSRPFAVLAHEIAHNRVLAGPELTVALRKLLEAKDCAVRAALA